MKNKSLSMMVTGVLVFTLVISVCSDVCEPVSLSSVCKKSFTTSTLNPKTPSGWSDDQRFTYGTPLPCQRADVTVWDNTVHVVWENASGDDEIFYRRSMDGGRTWGVEKQITTPWASFSVADSPRIAVNGSNIHVVYEDDINTKLEVYYVNSTDNGEMWNAPRRLSELNVSNSWLPDIAVEGDNIYVVWQDSRGGQPEVYFKKSNNNGKTWSDDIALTPVDGYTSGDPSVAVNGNNIHIVLGDYRDGNWESYYKRSSDGGDTWSADIPISSIDGFNSDAMTIAVNGSNVHVVWQDNMGYSADEIHYRNSTDNGDTWNDERNITLDDGFYSSQPRIAVNGSNIHIVWIDARDGYDFADAYELYYRSSTDDGITWGTEVRLTTAPKHSIQPGIACTESYIHVVWQDNRTGGNLDYEIYYKRSPDFGNETFMFNLNSGWNLITLPLNNTTYECAEDLIQAISNCTYVGKWNSTSQQFEMHKKGTNENNFTIDNGTGYFVYVNSSSTFTICGGIVNSSEVALVTGWNSLGWYNFTVTDAESIGKEIVDCTAVAYWDNTLGRFIAHPVGTNISNFTVERGMGYLVYIA